MFQLFVEGQGEQGAAQKLVQKIVHHYGLEPAHFSEGRRIGNLHTTQGIEIALKYARIDKNTEGVLILRDDEDHCPANHAPLVADFIRTMALPFPVAYCIVYREFESLFVAHAPAWAGKTIPHRIRGSFTFIKDIPVIDAESRRDAKGWITDQLAGGTVYKPTVDQLSLTQALNIETLQASGLACFGTLCRCIDFLVTNRGRSVVYPEGLKTEEEQ